jgi:hypothetical protein
MKTSEELKDEMISLQIQFRTSCEDEIRALIKNQPDAAKEIYEFKD